MVCILSPTINIAYHDNNGNLSARMQKVQDHLQESILERRQSSQYREERNLSVISAAIEFKFGIRPVSQIRNPLHVPTNIE